LFANVELNGNNVDELLDYSTSSSSIASVSGSGLINFVSTGSCFVTINLVKNILVSASALVNVSASAIDNYEVRISPPPSIILEGDTQNFICYLYKNGIQQSDSFIFASGSSVPNKNYSLTIINGNSFSVKNIEKYLENPLSIVCSSGSYVDNAEILLNGLW
jgi:hypothetical protein